jgi:signal transduction histidine kinase
MQGKRTGFSRRYLAALLKHLKRSASGRLDPAKGLGRQALTLGLATLDLARIHEQALATLDLASDSHSGRKRMVRRAGDFFAEAITPIEKTHRTAKEATANLNQMIRRLNERGVELAASNRQLQQEIAQRKAVEEALRKSERHQHQLLAESRQMQEQLRFLSRQLLSAQEEERKMISRELHDVIAQTLTSINVRLANLKRDARNNARGFERNIVRTQQLIEQSVNIVHRFARELRPTVLDDLGLIPALHTFLKGIREQTGIRISLSAFADVERVNGDKRTVLYRVAQEALTNVTRHAHATRAEVKIQKLDGAVCMRIKDNGKGFQEQPLWRAKMTKRLGLLGMRERLEMVGGNFTVASAPGKGTTVLVQIPLTNRPRGRKQAVPPLKSKF